MYIGHDSMKGLTDVQPSHVPEACLFCTPSSVPTQSQNMFIDGLRLLAAYT